MLRISCLLAVIVASSVIAADTPAQTELKALAGKWKVTSGELVGQPVPKDLLPSLTFELRPDGTASGVMADGEKVEVTFTLDTTAKPKGFTATHDGGLRKGDKQYGIYKLDGGKLTFCVTVPGAKEEDRPKEFATKGTAYVLFVFERVEGDKK